MKSQESRRDDDMKRIRQLEGEVARLRLQHDSYTDAAIQTTNEEDEVLLMYTACSSLICYHESKKLMLRDCIVVWVSK